MKKMLKKLIRREKGQALPIVLIMMVLGGLIVAPLLSYTTSGLKVSQAYERMAEEFYAADAGVEDGLWQIKYDHLSDLFSNYERYDYDTTYQYPITYPVDVNGIDVDIEIENVWIPDISEPSSLDEANRLAETDKLIIAGCVSAELTQQVKIHYKQEVGDLDLFITSIGIWLPPGFSYDELGECTLETHLDENPDVDYTRASYAHKGGEAVVWTFAEPAPFTAFPGVSTMDTPMTCSFTFLFTRDDPASQRNPEAVSWLTASGVADFPYTWDADIRVFHINSVANSEQGTTIDAYAIKSDPRQLVSGVEGDYRAVGNTLMLNLEYDWFGPVRDHLLNESAATVDDIPANAHVEAAFLYWSAWLIAEEEELTIFTDSCVNIWDKWIPGSDWEDHYDYWNGYFFRAHHSYYHGDDDRELVLKEAIPLSIYESATLSFEYWDDGRLEYNDCLKYAFSSDGGGTWSGWNEVFCDDTYGGTATEPIPEEYLTADFKMKFRIEGFDGSGGYGGTEYCYIDNIEITAELEEETVADTEVFFEIGGEPVYLAEDINGELTIPTQGEGSIFANSWKVVPNEDTPENDYSYCCKTDVTPLVQEFTDHGNEIYTLGGVDGTLDSQWSYAGWSLVIIYSSPETQRHQLYLFDLTTGDFRYIAPNGSGISFPISGFLVPDPIEGETTAATITCFLGDGDDYYSGDFIAINAPEGLEGPEIPNSYKLWDGITLYAEWGWPQPRMDNTEYSPNNVWNSRSTGFGGEEIDGVDIDTFYVPWGDPPSDGLLKPGDSSATITLNFAGSDLYTAELLNFIYIIIAFRSETVTGGTVSYLIEG
ncbi:MAG: hypothetical protein PVJ08_01550 [Dehalococcoidia bacterium]